MELDRTPSRATVLLGSVAILFLVSYIDYITGYEFLFFVFYFIPVALCGWWLGLWSTLGMAAVSGLSWFLVDRLSGHTYPHEAYRYWNGFICFAAFACIGVVLHRLRQALLEQRRARQELAAALEELKRTTEEIRRLQSEFQVVCAWTKRIRVNGQWMPLDQFLSDKLHLPISHGISPQALVELQKSLDRESLS